MGLDTKIAALKHLDVYRDGGIGASFVGANGIEYSLSFVIGRGLTPDMNPKYGPPILKWYCPYMYRSPVTGDTSPMFRSDSEPIDWSEARRIVNELEPFVTQLQSDAEVFDAMRQAVAQDGQ